MSTKGRGLPPGRRMRANTHLVDHTTSGRPATVGRMIPIDKIHPNPGQPRRNHVGIDELAESIREKGILEPILVRPNQDGTWEIVAGERRWRAASRVGLSLVPCIELDVDDQGSLEISLIENLQRRDLDPFEEAEAIARLVEEFGYTHEQIARKLGRSRTSITEILSLNRMPDRVKAECRRADILAKSTLMEIVRQPDEETMLQLVQAIAQHQLTRDDVRNLKRDNHESTSRQRSPEARRRRPFVFRYRPPTKDFTLSLRFEKEVVEPRELLSVLEQIVADLRSQVEQEEAGKGNTPGDA